MEAGNLRASALDPLGEAPAEARRGFSASKEDWYDDQFDWPGCRRKAALLLTIGLGVLGIAAWKMSG